MKTVYSVSSGSYSDYSVSCLFESAADAWRYIQRTAEFYARRSHENAYPFALANPHMTDHQGVFETCPHWSCRDYRRNLEDVNSNERWGCYVEEFQLWEEGEVPVAD